jgi:hypothetical protein
MRTSSGELFARDCLRIVSDTDERPLSGNQFSGRKDRLWANTGKSEIVLCLSLSFEFPASRFAGEPLRLTREIEPKSRKLWAAQMQIQHHAA